MKSNHKSRNSRALSKRAAKKGLKNAKRRSKDSSCKGISDMERSVKAKAAIRTAKNRLLDSQSNESLFSQMMK